MFRLDIDGTLINLSQAIQIQVERIKLSSLGGPTHAVKVTMINGAEYYMYRGSKEDCAVLIQELVQ